MGMTTAHHRCQSLVLTALVCTLVLLTSHARAEPTMLNYMAYSPTLASAGQPTQDQLAGAAQDGVERVVYLALTDQDRAIPNEDRVVRELGMQFVHIPVIWQTPTVDDFETFAAVLNQDTARNTLVHCQVNWRASSFVFLYRVIYQHIPIDEAFLDLVSVWTPSEHWREFITEVLSRHGKSTDCELCDWGDA